MELPPFCPNPRCPLHTYDQAKAHPRFWRRAGIYHTKVSGRVQRYVCSVCGSGFSERTWSIDYYTKKVLNYRELQRGLSASENISALARHLDCSVASVQNRLDRLGRNALALQARLLAGHHLSEQLCADGFESFDSSQFFPNAIHLLVGSRSQFLYAWNHVTLRRKGRMTTQQRLKRQQYDKVFRPKPLAIQSAFTRLLATIPPLWDHRSHPLLILHTDEHRAYPPAITHVPALDTARSLGSFRHDQYPSTAPRTLHNPLFPVNYYDRELRKDMAAFHRESVCFTRNVANGMLRLATYAVWHNYLKPYRIRPGSPPLPVHAVMAGIPQVAIDRELDRFFRHRAFLSQQELSPDMRTAWLKLHKTPLKTRPDYYPKFAHIGNLQGSTN